MNETCVFCKKNHLPIHPIFDEIIANDNLESEKIIYFMKIIETELKQNHWNEVFCMITLAISAYRIPQNIIEIIFLLTLRNIENCILHKPELNEIQKFMKNLTMRIEKISMEQKLKHKNTDNADNFNIEIDRLDKIFEALKNKSNIEPSLKNYILYRLMTFLEYKTYDTIRRAIDGKNQNKITYGKEILGLGMGLFRKVDGIISLILQQKIFDSDNDNYKFNSDASFFEFCNNAIEITSPDLKIFFKENYENDWYTLIDILNNKRNNMAHEMSDVNYDLEKLENIMQLMKIFLYGFPHILVILIIIITKREKDEEISSYITSISPNLNYLNAKILSNDDFFDLALQHFDGEFKTGLVEYFNTVKGFGFIKSEKDENVYFHKKNTDEVIKQGDKVEFLIGKGMKGPEARQVRKIK
jgi:cold shock CspA family protein